MRVNELRAVLAPPIPENIPKGDRSISSVLIPIGWNRETEREEIVLTKRTQWVETHKGQISFPGGFWEACDRNLLDTALRESEEEIGTKASDVEILGTLEPVLTRGNILIHPWVSKIELPYSFTVNSAEVAQLLYLPFETLIAEGLKPVDVNVGEYTVASIGISVDGELVWGATARLLEQLVERLKSL
jgi:8-oxo-dGTP pyrophosphatase MutT (NUDIX family)